MRWLHRNGRWICLAARQAAALEAAKEAEESPAAGLVSAVLMLSANAWATQQIAAPDEQLGLYRLLNCRTAILRYCLRRFATICKCSGRR